MRLFRRSLIAVGSVVELYRINNTEHLPQYGALTTTAAQAFMRPLLRRPHSAVSDTQFCSSISVGLGCGGMWQQPAFLPSNTSPRLLPCIIAFADKENL
jgi:hypothetical protein